MLSKAHIRKAMKEAVAAISAQERERREQVLATDISRLLEQKVGVVALYMAMPDEIGTNALIEMLSSKGWRIVVPAVCGGEMDFFDYNAASLHEGQWGIFEPEVKNAICAEDIDIMIVPGRAFTKEGHRLGRGKGYYDRFLARQGFHAQTIGVCFKEQIVEELPSEPHDKIMGIVLSA